MEQIADKYGLYVVSDEIYNALL
ncbi:MAG: hypothetical protein ACE5IR_14440 [bacterium]